MKLFRRAFPRAGALLPLAAVVLALLTLLCLASCDPASPIGVESTAANTEPSTEAPGTEAPIPDAPVPGAPATEAPATEAPATEAPATEAPATEAPATEAPATEAPATEAPATEAPATEAPHETEAPPVETYVLTASAEDPAHGSVTATDENGDPITLPLVGTGEALTAVLTAVPAEGYVFEGWYCLMDDGSESRHSNDAEVTVSIRNFSMVLVCRFLPKEPDTVSVTVTVDDPARGFFSVSGEDGDFSHFEKTGTKVELTLTAYAVPNFRFEGWYTVASEVTLLSTNMSLQISAEENTRILACFTPVYSFRLTASEGGIICLNRGEVTADILTSAAEGDELLLEAYPDEGYVFKGFWRVNSLGILLSPVSEKSVHTLLMPAEKYYVKAVFEKAPSTPVRLSVNVNHAELGGFTVGGGSAIRSSYTINGQWGQVYTFHAAPADECRFLGWYLVDGDTLTLLTESTTLQYDMSDGAASIRACYTRDVLVSLTLEGDGTVVFGNQVIEDDSEELSASAAQTVEVKAIPDGDWVFKGWYQILDGKPTLLSDKEEMTFTVPVQDSVLVAVFEETHFISVTSSGMTQPCLTVNGNTEAVTTYSDYVPSSYTLSLSAAVPEGYHFYGWYTPEDGELILYSRETDVELTMSDEDIRLVARYGELRTVTVKIVGGGSVYHENTGTTYTEDFTLTMAPGEYFVLTAPPTEEYAMTGWFAADAQGNPSSLVSTVCMMCPFRTPNQDWVLVALFEPRCTFSAVASTPEGGGIRVNDEEQLHANWGTSTPGSYSVTVTAVPAEGYVFLGWYRDPYGQRELYSTEARITVGVAEDMTLEALFVIEEAVRVNVISNEYYEGLVFLDGDEVPEDSDGVEVMIGSRVQLYAHPIWDSRFVAWYVYNFEIDDYELYSTAAHLWVTVTEETHFLAVFEPIPYISINGSAYIPGYEEGDPLPTLTLNGEELDDFFLSYEDQEGTVITIVTGDLEGYEFLGWYTEIWDSENWSDEPGEPDELLTTSHTYVLTLEGADEFRVLAVYALLNP